MTKSRGKSLDDEDQITTVRMASPTCRAHRKGRDEPCCDPWNKLISTPERIISIGHRQ